MYTFLASFNVDASKRILVVRKIKCVAHEYFSWTESFDEEIIKYLLYTRCISDFSLVEKKVTFCVIVPTKVRKS